MLCSNDNNACDFYIAKLVVFKLRKSLGGCGISDFMSNCDDFFIIEGCPTLGINEDLVYENSGSIYVEPNLSRVKN
jgi:hypothetical protein